MKRTKLAVKSGIRITGLRDASNGPICGDCAGRLLEGRHPVEGYKCPMCRRVWSHLEPSVRCIACGEHWPEGEDHECQEPRREAKPLEQCGRCASLYVKEEGHICPRLPTPRRREAIEHSRSKL